MHRCLVSLLGFALVVSTASAAGASAQSLPSERENASPASLLKQRKLDIKKGDRVRVTGSRVTHGDSEILLAREVRQGDTIWGLRDRAGQPLWSTTEPERRRF